MQEEIKEILDYLGNDKNYNCDCNDGSYYLELPYREAHELKDYITNLQEENERLNLIIIAIKKQCEVWEDYEMSEFIKQLENEKEISNWLKKVAGVDKE